MCQFELISVTIRRIFTVKASRPVLPLISLVHEQHIQTDMHYVNMEPYFALN